MIAVIIIVAVVTGAIAVITAATRTRPPGRHATDGDAERASMAKLRGQPADRFTPGVVLPRTPQLGEPLTPLPVILPPRQPDADDAYDDVKAIVADPPPEPRHEPLLERYERLIDSRPREVQELLHHHRNSEEAVQSILQRALTPDLLAKMDADKAMANGQVSGD